MVKKSDTRWLFCKVQKWQPKLGELPPIGSTITNGMLHQPVKAFRTRSAAIKFSREEAAKNSQRFIPDIIEITLDDSALKGVLRG